MSNCNIKALAVIPARLASTRLPEKPLVKLRGRELVLRVLDGAASCGAIDRVIAAVDDERVAAVVRSAGYEAMMTPPELPTGGDRVAYVAERVPSEYVINIQGDDPLVCAAHIEPLIAALDASPDTGLAVLAKRIDDEGEVSRPSIVKMVFASDGGALYFSRSPIPYARAGRPEYFKHIGPYAWRRAALFDFARLPQTPLELAESLEMLRLLESGRKIACVRTEIDCIEIDTPEDVMMFEQYFDKIENTRRK